MIALPAFADTGAVVLVSLRTLKLPPLPLPLPLPPLLRVGWTLGAVAVLPHGRQCVSTGGHVAMAVC